MDPNDLEFQGLDNAAVAGNDRKLARQANPRPLIISRGAKAQGAVVHDNKNFIRLSVGDRTSETFFGVHEQLPTQ